MQTMMTPTNCPSLRNVIVGPFASRSDTVAESMRLELAGVPN